MKVLLIPTASLVLLVVFILLINFTNSANTRVLAQMAPELLVTWRANNYTPLNYAGKSLPTRETQVYASLELIDALRPADISKREIRWLLNNRLYKSGVGLKKIVFAVPELTRDNQLLRALVVNYRGQNVEQLVRIPVVDPEAVIGVPYPNRKIGAGENFFMAFGYFFNVNDLNDLSFLWSANGASARGENDLPNLLKLNALGGRSGDKINLSVSISNKINPLELASDNVALEIQ